MTNQLRSALIHVASLMKQEDYVEVNFQHNKGEVECILTKEEEGVMIKPHTFYKLPITPTTHNPIAAIIASISDEICNDCIKLDYYFKDPFFISLIKAYIEVLVQQYGTTVPITRSLARAILMHSLSEHKVYYKAPDGGMWATDLAGMEQLESTISFHLTVN